MIWFGRQFLVKALHQIKHHCTATN